MVVLKRAQPGALSPDTVYVKTFTIQKLRLVKLVIGVWVVSGFVVVFVVVRKERVISSQKNMYRLTCNLTQNELRKS